MSGLRQILIPTFHALYPGKKMAFVVDHAPYHKCRGPEGEININDCKRAELVEWICNKCADLNFDKVSWDRKVSLF